MAVVPSHLVWLLVLLSLAAHGGQGADVGTCVPAATTDSFSTGTFTAPPVSSSASITTVSRPAQSLLVFPVWCSDADSGTPACPTLSLSPYTNTITDDVVTDPRFDSSGAYAFPVRTVGAATSRLGSFFALPAEPLATLNTHVGGALKPYSMSVSFRHHHSNTVNNVANVLPVAAVRLYLLDGLAPSLLSVVNTPLPWQVQHWFGVPMLVNGSVVNFVEFTANSADWQTFSFDFTLRARCDACRMVVSVECDGWVSWSGNQYFIADLQLLEPAVTFPHKPHVHVANHTVAKIPVMPAPAEGVWQRSSCPHLTGTLALWQDVATWPSGSVPAAGEDVTLPDNTRVLINSCSVPAGAVFGTITIPSTSSLVFDDADISLDVHNIVVMGRLEAGSPTCRLFSKLTITLHGTKAAVLAASNTLRSKGIIVMGGTIDLHGKEYYTWARLAEAAYPGDYHVALQEAVNWEAGQRVVVAATVYHDYEFNENEVMTVAAVDASKKWVQFTTPLRYLHWASVEYQAEVGLLSRRIVVQGSASDSVPDEFGGHIMVMGGGVGRFQGVQAYHMGQKNQLARYPFHFHLLQSSPDSYVRDCAVEDAFYRCVVVHGTNDATVSGNVAYNVQGHCYYLEDGVEENNVLSFNLGVHISTIFARAQGGGQPGEWFMESDLLRNPADTSAGVFYITNAYNTFIGNAAVGGWTGYAFVNLPYPINQHKGADYSATNSNPLNRNVKVFDGNTAHSSGGWDQTGCIYVGGRLYHDSNNGDLLVYNSGRNSRTTYDVTGTSVAFMNFTNSVLSLCPRGLNHWGDQVEMHHVEIHDVALGFVVFGEAYVRDMLVTGRTALDATVDLGIGTRYGFQFYDTWTKTMLDNITFRNFDASEDDVVILGMVHSDTFKPQGIGAMRNVKYDNCARSTLFWIDDRPTGASWIYNIVDFDGSATLRGVPTVVGSHVSWWKYNPSCARDADWGLWLCDWDASKSNVVSFELTMPGVTRTEAEFSQPVSHTHVGYMSIMGSSGPTQLPLTKNPTTTGMSRLPWLLNLFAGSPLSLSIDTIQVPKGDFILLVIPYPAGSLFNVQIVHKYFADPPLMLLSVPKAASLAEILTPTEAVSPSSEHVCASGWPTPSFCNTGAVGPTWYFTGTHLYLRIVNAAHYSSTTHQYSDPVPSLFEFSRNGMWLGSINSWFEWRVTVTHCDKCSESAAFCYSPDSKHLVNTTYDIPQFPGTVCASKAGSSPPVCDPRRAIPDVVR